MVYNSPAASDYFGIFCYHLVGKHPYGPWVHEAALAPGTCLQTADDLIETLLGMEGADRPQHQESVHSCDAVQFWPREMDEPIF